MWFLDVKSMQKTCSLPTVLFHLSQLKSTVGHLSLAACDVVLPWSCLSKEGPTSQQEVELWNEPWWGRIIPWNRYLVSVWDTALVDMPEASAVTVWEGCKSSRFIRKPLGIPSWTYTGNLLRFFRFWKWVLGCKASVIFSHAFRQQLASKLWILLWRLLQGAVLATVGWKEIGRKEVVQFWTTLSIPQS